MESKYGVNLSRIVKDMGIKTIHKSSDFDEKQIRTSEINRPGLQLSGFYAYFDPARVQTIGMVETMYITGMTGEERLKSFDRFMATKPVAVVVCHRSPIFDECLEMAKKHDVSLFESERDTTEFIADLIEMLRIHLAPRQTMHGVLVEIHGKGVLITGDSGVGKSEAALELIKRGHKLIADDAVEVRKIGRNKIVGTAPELIRHYMEIRGIGLIDIKMLYGVGSVKMNARVDLVINMEAWDKTKVYDRLGISDERLDVLGVQIPLITIPIRPGRNVAVILETASMNQRLKQMGYDAAKAFVEKHDSVEDAGWISL